MILTIYSAGSLYDLLFFYIPKLLALSDCLILAILVGVQWCLIALLNEISILFMMWYTFVYAYGYLNFLLWEVTV